jgi:hypothetical protein
MLRSSFGVAGADSGGARDAGAATIEFDACLPRAAVLRGGAELDRLTARYAETLAGETVRAFSFGPGCIFVCWRVCWRVCLFFVCFLLVRLLVCLRVCLLVCWRVCLLACVAAASRS